jgi:hypothetical protein
MGFPTAADALAYVESLYAAGAVEVNVHPNSLPAQLGAGGIRNVRMRGGQARRLLVRLPIDQAARQQVMDVLQKEKVLRDHSILDWEVPGGYCTDRTRIVEVRLRAGDECG